MGSEGTANIEYLVDEKGRLEAGFEPQEIQVAFSQAVQRRTVSRAS
jgi:hypothetical protein